MNLFEACLDLAKADARQFSVSGKNDPAEIFNISA
jgi:hypothetical protein